MSTLKYKTTERYSFGWSDPRVSINAPDIYFPCINIECVIPTAFTAATTEALRNLWLVRWGHHAVEHALLEEAEAAQEPIISIMQELANRKHVFFDVHIDANTYKGRNYYVLEKEQHADR